MKRKTLFENDWLSVIELDGWYVASEESRTKDNTLVAVLGFRHRMSDGHWNELEFVGRYEWCPAHNQHGRLELSTLTGGVESADEEQDAVRELAEEAGVEKRTDELIDLGTVFPIKSSTACLRLFAVYVTEELTRTKGDGTRGEQDAFCEWVSERTMLSCKDPYMHTMIMRLKHVLAGKQPCW